MVSLKGESEGRTNVFSTSYRNGLLMCLYNVFHNGKTQTGSTYLSGSAFIGSVKSLEQARKVFFFDPNPIISNFN